jgi:hypothetical protein
MKRIAVVVAIVSSICAMQASEWTNLAEKKRDKEFPGYCCYFTAAVPACLSCVQKRKQDQEEMLATRRGNQRVVEEQSLSQSQELMRCP